MKILLDKDYFIKDGYGASFILVRTQKARDKKAKEQYRESSIAYGDLDLLLTRYARELIKENNKGKAITIKEYIQQYQTVLDDVTEMVRGGLV